VTPSTHKDGDDVVKRQVLGACAPAALRFLPVPTLGRSEVNPIAVLDGVFVQVVCLAPWQSSQHRLAMVCPQAFRGCGDLGAGFGRVRIAARVAVADGLATAGPRDLLACFNAVSLPPERVVLTAEIDAQARLATRLGHPPLDLRGTTVEPHVTDDAVE